MALTQVRAKLGNTWTTLALNTATGRYEGMIPAGSTSVHQPGGYWPVTVEVKNSAGATDTLGGDRFPSLRLVVRENTAPALSLISPAPGWLTTGLPVIVAEAVDETGGSGVNPNTFSPSGGTLETIPGGYRYTWRPPGGWADGPHTVTLSVKDYEGNTASISAAYQVDTVPPRAFIQLADNRHVVDAESAEVSVEATDSGAGVEWVSIGDTVITQPPYHAVTPLRVGENTIRVTVRDRAGLETSQDIYMIRLITDRTAADVDTLVNMYRRGMENWAAAELNWFNQCAAKGAYNYTDLNRVGAAVAYLSQELVNLGYAIHTAPKTDWTRADAPTRTQMAGYLQNVAAVTDTSQIHLSDPLPETMRQLTVDRANHIEKALVEVDNFLSRYFAWPSGSIQCGAV